MLIEILEKIGQTGDRGEDIKVTVTLKKINKKKLKTCNGNQSIQKNVFNPVQVVEFRTHRDQEDKILPGESRFLTDYGQNLFRLVLFKGMRLCKC